MAGIEPGIGWPGWETLRLIGRGGFGAVYEIRREVFGDTERCALKHISIPQSDNEIREMRSEGQDEQSISRSLSEQAREVAAEYKMMMRLSDCPNVVRCYDVEYTRKSSGLGWDINIRMELLTPLVDLLTRRLDWPGEEEIVRLGQDIARALIACDRLSIIHRDIKPQNIFVAGDGNYKLGDFGIARIAEKTGSATARIGTFTYMAPEVFSGRHYGASADLYSLGMLLYWLLNERRVPFVAVNTPREKEAALNRRMRGDLIPPPAHGSPWLQRIVLKACAYDPKDRYRSAEELLRDLENTELGMRHAALEPKNTANAPAGAAGGRPPAASTAQRAPEAAGNGAPAAARGPHPPQAVPLPPAGGRQGPSRAPAPAGRDAAPGGVRKTPERTVPADAAAGVIRRQEEKAAPAPAASTAQRALEAVGALHEAPASTGPNAAGSRPPATPTGQGPQKAAETGQNADRGARPARRDAAASAPAEKRRPSAEKETADDGREAVGKRKAPRNRKRAVLAVLAVLLGIAALALFLLRPRYGPWSAWSTERPETADWRKIEKSTAYRYCVGTLMSTMDKGEVKGEIDHQAMEYAVWGEYGDWQEEAIQATENREVDTILQYATARKETMTSGKENLEGWIFVEAVTEPAWGGVADAWSTTKPETSDTRQVVEKTQYCPIVDQYVNGEYSSSSSKEWSDTMDAGKDGSTLRYWYSNGDRYEERLRYNTRTVYSYRDLGTKTTYYYYRWGEWSDWSFDKAEEDENTQVKTRTLYRCREKLEVPVYYYYIWSDWSEWSLQPVQESDWVKVETRTVYRYMDREN